MAISRPKLSPADPIVMVFNPINHNDVFSGILLLIYYLLWLDSTGSINDWYTLFFVNFNGKVFSSLGTTLNGWLNNYLKEGLLSDIIIEKDAFKESTCLERSHACLGWEVDGLVVDQVHFSIVDPQSKNELTT